MTSREQSRPGGRRPYVGVIALGALACVLALGLMTMQTLRERKTLIERETDSLVRMTDLVAVQATDLVDRIHSFLEIADLWLAQRPEADPRTDPRFLMLVDSFRSSMKGQVDIKLVSKNGELFYLPAKSLEPLADLSDRSFVKAQLAPTTRGFYIGEPVKSRVTGQWDLPLSYPISAGNAGMAVIFASIRVRDIEALYDSIRPKPNGSVMLVTGKGVFVARAPSSEALRGTSVAGIDPADWRRKMDAGPTGVMLTNALPVAPGDRIIAYRAISSPYLVVSVSNGLREALAPWREGLWRRSLMALLIVVSVAYATRLVLGALRMSDEAHEELARSLERVRKSDEAKDKLFSVIAHDLRGPIGGMASLLEGLARDRDGVSEEQMDEFIKVLHATSWNTSQLLENLLAWARSQRSELSFRPGRLEVEAIIRECASVFVLSAAEKGLAVEIEVEDGLEAQADPDQLRILVRNLLSNAIKFTPRGKTVRLRAARTEGGTIIEVRDEGIGIDREQIASIFELGASRSRSGTANEKGSGLGLNLCKSIVDMHGGRIEVSSGVGEGSSFSVFLPL